MRDQGVTAHVVRNQQKKEAAVHTHTHIEGMLTALASLLEGACEFNYHHTEDFVCLHLLSLESV